MRGNQPRPEHKNKKYSEEAFWTRAVQEETKDHEDPKLRIFIFNKQIIDIIKREKPYIIGNGTDKITQLINKYNELEQQFLQSI